MVIHCIIYIENKVYSHAIKHEDDIRILDHPKLSITSILAMTINGWLLREHVS